MVGKKLVNQWLGNHHCTWGVLGCMVPSPGVCEEGCIFSYGTFGVQGSPQQSQAGFVAYS